MMQEWHCHVASQSRGSRLSDAVVLRKVVLEEALMLLASHQRGVVRKNSSMMSATINDDEDGRTAP